MVFILHITEAHNRNFLTGVATDSHRLSSSSIEVSNIDNFKPINFTKKNCFSIMFLISRVKKPVIHANK